MCNISSELAAAAVQDYQGAGLANQLYSLS